MSLVSGHRRKGLFSRTNSLAEQGGSVDFGTHEVQAYSRFTGMFFANSGSVTLRYRMAAHSGGPWLASSAITVNSGGNIFDVINYGSYADFAFTVINSSTTYDGVVQGEPLR